MQLSNGLHSACTHGLGHFCFPHVPLSCAPALGWRMLPLLPLLLHVLALLAQQGQTDTHTHTLSLPSLSFSNMGVRGGCGGKLKKKNASIFHLEGGRSNLI